MFLSEITHSDSITELNDLVTGTSKTRLHSEITWPHAVTFYDMICKVDRGDFNGSKIMEKEKGLANGLGDIDGFGCSISQLPPPSPVRINSCALTTRHTLGGIIVALNQLNSNPQK